MLQSYKKLDDFIIDFSGKIFFLKKYETDEKLKYSKHHTELFNELLNSLLKRNKFGLDQNLWTELYYHSIYFYKNIKKIGKIPAIVTTKHNFIVPFYMKEKLSNYNTTILHFDTHPDMNPVKYSSQLPDIYKKYLKNKNQKYLNQAQDIVWDIGASVSGTIFTTGIQNYIWCIPEWVIDPEIETSYFLKKNKESFSLLSNDKKLLKNSGLCDIYYTKKENKTEVEKIYSKIKIKNKSALNKLINIIKTGNNKKYILDIDLDYFVCNGKKLNAKRYMKEQYDVASFYRTKSIIVNEENPRDKSDNTPLLEKYEKQLHMELKYVNKRIRAFLKLIKSLKNRGYIPSHIDISDSTNVEFTGCKNCNSISNGYLPVHFALYVNTQVFNGLSNIFK